MSVLHLIFGIIVFIVFLATGRLMRMDFPDKDAISPEFRMLMRSRHIYILLSSLIHILLGLYFQLSTKTLPKYLQLFGSFLLILGSVLLIWAFAYETYGVQHFTSISRYGLYSTLAGTILHLIGKIGTKKDSL